MQNLPRTIFMPVVVLLILTLAIILIAVTAPDAKTPGIKASATQITEKNIAMPITNDVKFETLEPIDTSFYIGLLTGSSFTLIITSVFFMMKDQLEKRKRLIEMERIIKERDKMRSQLNNKMTFLSNRFRQTAETVTESRLVSDMLLLRENND